MMMFMMMVMMVFQISLNTVDDNCFPHMYSIEEIVFFKQMRKRMMMMIMHMC